MKKRIRYIFIVMALIMVGCTNEPEKTESITETPDVVDTPDVAETKEESSEEPIVLEKIEATQLEPHNIALTSEVNAYANPDTSSDVLETLNDSAMIIGEANDFYQVILANGSIAYIEKNFSEEKSDETENTDEVKEEIKEESKEEIKEEIKDEKKEDAKEEKKDEPKQVTIPSGFDAEFYAKNNPDVVAAFGNSPEALYNHYIKYGKKEGRAQNANEVDKREQVAQSIVSEPSVPSTPTAPETPSQPAPSTTTLTEAEVYNRIMALQSSYPEGMVWDNCFSFANIITASVCPETYNYTQGYGTPVSSIDNLKLGDFIHYSDSVTNGHYVVIIGKQGNIVTIAEGNYGGTVHWGRTLDLSQINILEMYSRY